MVMNGDDLFKSYLFNTPFLFMDLLMSRCKPSDFGVPYVPRQEPSWSQSGTAPWATESQFEASGTFFICFFLCLAFLWLASKLSCYEFQKASRVHKSAVPKRSQKSNSSANHRDQRQIFPPPPAPEPRKSRSGPNLGFRPRLPGMTMENGEKLRKKTVPLLKPT